MLGIVATPPLHSHVVDRISGVIAEAPMLLIANPDAWGEEPSEPKDPDGETQDPYEVIPIPLRDAGKVRSAISSACRYRNSCRFHTSGNHETLQSSKHLRLTHYSVTTPLDGYVMITSLPCASSNYNSTNQMFIIYLHEHLGVGSGEGMLQELAQGTPSVLRICSPLENC